MFGQQITAYFFNWPKQASSQAYLNNMSSWKNESCIAPGVQPVLIERGFTKGQS
jgi:hypothetical protein